MGEIVLLYKETGSKKGTNHRECKVLSRRENGKSYFIQEIGTDNRYLRARNKLRPLRELEPNNIAIRRLECFSIKMEVTVLQGILKKDGKKKQKRNRKIGVSFDGTCHVNPARVLVGKMDQ